MNIEYLRRALEVYPFDPGLALWRAIEANLFSKYRFKPPILDLGCGAGSFSLILFSKNLQGDSIYGRSTQGINIGLDLNLLEIQKAKKMRYYQDFIVADATNLPIKDCSFSTIISNCVIEHVSDLENSLKEIFRILKDDGIFLFTVPSELFGKYLLGTHLLGKLKLEAAAQNYEDNRNKSLSHLHLYSPKDWKEKLNYAGLEVVKQEYYLPARGELIWDILFSLARFGFWKLDIMNILNISDRLFPFFRIKAFMIRLSEQFLLNFYSIADDKGGALFIIVRKNMRKHRLQNLNKDRKI